MADIPKNFIVDSGYWYALFSPRDGYHQEAQAKAHYIDILRLVFPWPTLYETVGTQFIKNRFGMNQFERLLKRPNVLFMDDTQYRDEALEATLRVARLGKRNISLCDMLIRLLLQDASLRIDALLTFNIKDFYDVCGQRVQIL